MDSEQHANEDDEAKFLYSQAARRQASSALVSSLDSILPALRSKKIAEDGASLESVDDSDVEATDLGTVASSERRENEYIRGLQAKNERKENANKLRNRLGYWSLGFVGGQLVVSDALVGVYVGSQIYWHNPIPPQIIIAWMSASLIEVIGILWVIARSLFPFHDKYRDRKAEIKQHPGESNKSNNC